MCSSVRKLCSHRDRQSEVLFFFDLGDYMKTALGSKGTIGIT